MKKTVQDLEEYVYNVCAGIGDTSNMDKNVLAEEINAVQQLYFERQLSLACELDMPVITEGVETEEQVKFLSEMGCDIFQGYYFAKPMDIKTFETTYM